MDAVRTAIMSNRFNAIVEEASAAVYRTAHTTFVKLVQDYQCAVATVDGDMFAYPMLSGVNVFVGSPLKPTLDAIGRENLKPGDIVITNDPFTTDGLVTHLMDITLLYPIFRDDRLIAIGWAFVHASGIHATIAGVVLAFTIPVLHRVRDRAPDAGPGLAEQFEYRFRPLSAGFAVPVFAFFSAGVAIGGIDGFVSALTDPLTVAIVAALVLGKPVGILATTWLMTRVARIRLDPALRWVDLAGVGLLAGIGFTVSLLVAELSFTPGSVEHDHAKVAILTASVLAALLAAIVLTARNRRYRKISERDAIDADGDGVPDVYQTGA